MKKEISRALQAQYAMNQVINAESARDLSRDPNAAIKAVKEYYSLSLTDANGKSNNDGYIARFFEDFAAFTGLNLLNKKQVNLRKRILGVGEYNYSAAYTPQRQTRNAIADYLDCCSYEEVVKDAEDIIARMEATFQEVLANGCNVNKRALSPSTLKSGALLTLVFPKGTILLQARGNDIFKVLENTNEAEDIHTGDFVSMHDTLVRGNYVFIHNVRRYTESLGNYITRSAVVDFSVKMPDISNCCIAC